MNILKLAISTVPNIYNFKKKTHLQIVIVSTPRTVLAKASSFEGSADFTSKIKPDNPRSQLVHPVREQALIALPAHPTEQEVFAHLRFILRVHGADFTVSPGDHDELVRQRGTDV